METNPRTRRGVLEAWILDLQKQIADRTSISWLIAHGDFHGRYWQYMSKNQANQEKPYRGQSFVHFLARICQERPICHTPDAEML
jgi:hypothetical protein